MWQHNDFIVYDQQGNKEKYQKIWQQKSLKTNKEVAAYKKYLAQLFRLKINL